MNDDYVSRVSSVESLLSTQNVFFLYRKNLYFFKWVNPTVLKSEKKKKLKAKMQLRIKSLI